MTLVSSYGGSPSAEGQLPPSAVELRRRELLGVPTEEEPRYIPEGDMSFCRVTSEDMLQQALRLQTIRYLDEGYITEEDVDEGGILKEEIDSDRYRSGYFVLLRNNPKPGESKIVATVRLVPYDPEMGLNSFPVLRNMTGIQPVIKTMFERMDLSDAVEVSGLAEAADAHPTAAFELYREIWKEAAYKKQRSWIFGADNRLYQTLTAVFGEGILAIGRGEEYMGSTSYPAMIDPVGIVDVVLGQMQELREMSNKQVGGLGALLLAQKQLIDFFFHDFDTSYLTPSQLEILEYTRQLEIHT